MQSPAETLQLNPRRVAPIRGWQLCALASKLCAPLASKLCAPLASILMGACLYPSLLVAQPTPQRAPTTPSIDEALRNFRPQTPREAAMVSMIQQLQQEIALLRRQVHANSAPPRGAEPAKAPNDDPRFALPPRWEATKAGGVFRTYDKNGDLHVSLEEWLAMTNGNISPARRALQTQRYLEAEPTGDGRFPPGEFIWWYNVGRHEDVQRQRAAQQRVQPQKP